MSKNVSDQQLLELLARANNLIMEGSYSGDQIFEAAEVMIQLTELYDSLGGGRRE